MKTRLFGLLLLVSFTVLVTGEYNSYGRQPSSSSFGAVYNDTHESRSAKRYINNDNPIPGDLLDNLVVDGFNRPVNIEFAPDGRIFVAEKAGVIKIVNADGTVQAEPWIDISRKVHDAADRGMLGMVLDPNFAVNKWVYVLYVRNPQEGVPNINANVASIGVIARYYDTPNGRADVGSEQILLGDGLNNGFPCCSNSHLVGDLAFGLDGTLFASAGDGARWEWVDDGSNRTPEDATCEQLFPNDDIGAFRAQSLDSLGGKIIRINKENGNGIGPENGLVANPMYDAANPKSIRSRIWVWGLRNPYRIHVRKDSNVGPGSIYISDVGFYDWEEFNLVREPGVNFGWPCVVADEIVDPEYNNAVANPIAAARCREILQLPRKSPLIYYNHWTPDWAGFTGNSPVGTAIYYGDSYPDRYTGDSTDRAVFCADFGYERWIRVFWVDENDNFKPEKGIQYLAGGIGPIVGLKSNPFTGDIYYWLLGGQIRRFVPADRPVINTPPRVYLAANPSSGNVALNGPLTVSFSSYGTFDQERNKFTMLWDFGDGSTSYEANPTHVYTTSGEFTVTLSVTDDEGLVGTKTMIVRTNNIAPTVRITSPVDNFVFPTETGTRTPFRATVTDPDTPGTGLNYRWEFRVVHNNHFHMDEFVTFDREFDFDLAVGVSALERNMLEIFLVVTDEAGDTAQDMIRVRPAGMTNGGPTAVLAVTPLTGDVLHNIALDATGSIDPDQDMLHIIWDFGDGSVISTYADMRTFYTYSRPGTYQVKVTVVDVFAVESESAPITVTVTGEPVPTSTGPLTTGPATTGPATTGAATTGPDTTGPATTTPDTSAPGSTGAETTASGPDTTSGGNTGVTTTAPGTTSDPASTSNPSETTTASSTTESASTEGPVTTGSEITTGEEPNETTVGTTDKEPEVTTTSNSNNRQSSASSITMSFVVISISLIFVALL